MLPLIVLVMLQMVAVIICFALLIGIIALFISDMTDVPFVPTPRKYIAPVITLLGIEPHDVVYELGSGDGRFIIAAARTQPDARFVGIERNPILVWVARIRVRMAGSPQNVVFKRKDLFASDLSDATKIYCYLLPHIMDRLLPQCERQLHNAVVVSRAFQFTNKQPTETVRLAESPGLHGQNRLYRYEF